MTGPAFVHVIAIIDLTHVSGDIKYVVPLTSPPTGPASAGAAAADEGRAWFVVRDRNGAELDRTPLAVGRGSCAALPDGAEPTEGGLVQHTLRLPEGAAGLDLVIDGRTVDSFDAPPDEEPAAGPALTNTIVAAAGPMPEMTVPPSRHRRTLIGGEVAAEPGTSYTVQVKPPASAGWTTLSVGRPTPAFNLDRNQFSGASEVDVRIIRSRGFRSDLHLERRLSLHGDDFASEDGLTA